MNRGRLAARERLLESSDAWAPDNPETAPTWLCHRLLIEYPGWTPDTLSTMPLHVMANHMEALLVTRDVQMAARAPKDSPSG